MGTLRQFGSLWFCAGAAILLTAWASTGILAADDNVIETFVVAEDGDLLLLPLKVAGLPFKELGEAVPIYVDMGSAYGICDEKLASFLETTPAGRTLVNGPGGKIEKKLVRLPQASLGERIPVQERTILHDLQPLRDATGLDMRGAIGMEFLAQHVIRIDFDAGRLQFLKSAAKAPGEAIPLHLAEDRTQTCQVRLPGIGEKTFRIDTGPVTFTNGTLSRATIDELTRARQLQVEQTVIGDSNSDAGARVDRSLTVSKLSLGSFEHEGLLFSEGTQDVLALGYLSRYAITFDFPNQTMYLVRGKQFERRIRPLGIHWVLRRGKTDHDGFRILESEPGGLAHAAGIRKGSRLVSVNSQSLGRMSVFELRMLLARLIDQDREIEVTIIPAGGGAPQDIVLRKSETRSAKKSGLRRVK